MRQRWLFLLVIAFGAICIIAAWLWDFRYHVDSPLISNLIAGFLTIIGAFLLAYWVYERRRIQREKEEEKREIELKQRIVVTLNGFIETLVPWLYHYACMLSGNESLYDKHRQYRSSDKDDFPKLEDVFGIGSHDPQGNRLRGTEEFDSVNEKVIALKISPGDVFNSLYWGRRIMRQINKELNRFPQLAENVDSEVAEIVNLRDELESRWDEVRQWEIKYEKQKIYVMDETHSDIKHNLRTLGKITLNIIIAIYKEIDTINSKIQN